MEIEKSGTTNEQRECKKKKRDAHESNYSRATKFATFGNDLSCGTNVGVNYQDLVQRNEILCEKIIPGHCLRLVSLGVYNRIKKPKLAFYT